MSKKPLEIDMIAGSQLRDSQGEMLSVEGADITPLLTGHGRLNDNHGKGFYNSIGRVTEAKKIFTEADCSNDRHKYYWEKVKSPFIYVKGHLYDDEDHPNARAAAAILRNVHKKDCPLKMKASVEGGVVARGIKDQTLLARTKIHSVALTFTPANQGTLVEPVSLAKSAMTTEDEQLIKSVMHLATVDVPSFRHVTRRISADKIAGNIEKIKALSEQLNLKTTYPTITSNELVKKALEEKIQANVVKINSLVKMLSAGYGGGSPSDKVGGAVIQSETLEDGRPKGFKHISCNECGKEQVYMKHQVKCRECGHSFSLEALKPHIGKE